MISRVLTRWKERLHGHLIDLGESPSDSMLLQGMREIGADRTPDARGKSLYEHLLGAAHILRSWDTPPEIVRAGHFYSVYSADRDGGARIDHQHRNQLRGIIGTASEELVYLFSAVDRKALLCAVAEAHQSNANPDFFRLQSLCNKATVHQVTRKQASALITLETAATAERSAALDSGPAPWLYLVQKNARLVAALGGPLLPLANPEEPEISRHQEKLLIQEYASLARFRKRRQFSNMLGIPEMWIGEFFVWLAFWSSVDGDATSAVGHAVNASERLMRLGVAWDKRLHLKEWLFVADAIARGAGQLKQARKSAEFIESPQALHELFHHQVPSGSALVAALSDFRTTLPGDGHKTDHAVGERLQQYLTGIDRNQSTKQIGEFPNLHSIPVWNAGDFPIVQALEASFDGIREELQSSQENWNTLILFGHGHKHLEVCVLLPLITTIIERYETVRTVSGTVVFRRLRARSHTNPHKGPTNVRVRCCLPIQVPEGDVGLRVGHELLAWSAGNCLVFSDFEDHEMWNNTDADCLLLEIDLWHPLLSKAEISSLRGLHKYSQFFEEKSQKNSPAAVVNPFILHNGLKARSGQKDTDVCWSEDPLPIGRAI